MLALTGEQQADLNRVAERFVAVLLTHLADTDEQHRLTGPLPVEVAERVLRLRPHAQRTVDALLLMAMQRQTDRLMEQLAAVSAAREPTGDLQP